MFAYTYFARFDDSRGQIKIQESELQTFRFVNADDLETERRSHPEKFTLHSERYWSELINGVKKRFKISG